MLYICHLNKFSIYIYMQLNAVMCNGIDLNHCGSAGTIRSVEMNCFFLCSVGP